MRIIGKRRDYYDTALSYGIDLNLVYVRKEEEWEASRVKNDKFPSDTKTIIKPLIDILNRMPNYIYEISSRRINPSIVPFIVGFCGKIHLGLYHQSSAYYTIKDKANGKAYYDTYDMISKIPEKVLEHQRFSRSELAEKLNSKIPPKTDLTFRPHLRFTHDYWKKIKEEVENKRFDDIFIKFNTPIFSLVDYGDRNNYRFTINPNLEFWSFVQVKYPTQCFQEISMYLGNQLALQQDPVPLNVSDSDMIHKKGFDKWSFRRHKDDPKFEKSVRG
jgi:hypothetical protein